MDLKKLKAHCQRTSELTREVIDDFLMPYAGQLKLLGKEMNRQFERYRHITIDFPASMLPMLQAQYLVHRLFKKDGLIRKYLNHADLRILTAEHREFLESQISHPWEFSFAQIQESLGDDFYEMIDVFTEETYVLYSPGTTETLEEYPYRLWFNLIGFNGECYQSYGPIVGYLAFTPDDIFFFANELTDDVETDEDVRRVIDKQPVPFMMLATGSSLPSFAAKDGQEMLYAFSEFYIPSLPEIFPEEVFESEEYMGLVKLKPAGEEKAPHFAAAYYDREEKILQLTSMTLNGHKLLVQAFKKLSLDFEEWPHLIVSIAMHGITELILKREVAIFPYESLFDEELDIDEEDYFDFSVDEDETFDDLNKAIIGIIPYINRGEYPDIRSLAKQYNLEEEELKRVVDQIIEKLGNM